MNLVLDIFEHGHHFTLEDEVLVEELFDYIFKKLGPLLKEIEAESKVPDDDAVEIKAIHLYLLERPKRLEARGYAGDLDARIMACFDQYDAYRMWRRAKLAIARLLN